MAQTSVKSPAPRKKKAWKDVLRLAGVAAFFVAVGFLLNHESVRSHLFDIERLRTDIQGSGARGVMTFAAVGAMVTALGIPRLWVCAVAGSLFGAAEGSVIALGTTLVGACLDFLMGRSLLRGPIKRHLPQRLRRWYKAFNKHGFKAILYMRLFPGANATVTSLLGGASHMRFRDFFAATFIGFLPFTIVFATLGSSAAKQSKWQLAGGLLLFCIVAVGQWIISRARKKLDVASDEPTEAIGPVETGKVNA